MREIKFRGKLSHSKQWVYGNLIIANNGGHYIIPQDVFEPDGHHLRIDSDNPYWVDSETIGQYLYTQNNIEVYDGDILRVNEYENLYFKLTGEDYENTNIDDYSLTDVKGQLIDSYVSNVYCESNIDFLLRCGEFSELMASQLYEDQKRCSTICEFELLGNIHDNPELLTKN